MSPSLEQLRRDLDEVVATGLMASIEQEPARHAEGMAIVSAILCEAFRTRGLRATLVGGGVIEINAPGTYTTPDIDLVIEQIDPKGEQVASVFRDLGFVPSGGRHWLRDPDLMVEVPGVNLDVPYETRQVGPLELRLVHKEVVLVERLVGFDQTGNTFIAAQAVLMLRAWAGRLNQTVLRDQLRRERCERVYEALEAVARSTEPVTDGILQQVHDRLHRRWGDREPPADQASFHDGGPEEGGPETPPAPTPTEPRPR